MVTVSPAQFPGPDPRDYYDMLVTPRAHSSRRPATLVTLRKTATGRTGPAPRRGRGSTERRSAERRSALLVTCVAAVVALAAAPAAAQTAGTIFLANLSENRSENVTMVDLRLDKTIAAGARGRLTLMADFYNLLNANAVTNFSLRTGDYERTIAALDPLAMKLGLRFQW